MADIFSKFNAGFKGFISAFKSPGEPMRAAMPPGAAPSGWDYPYGYNMNVTPRMNENISFDDLRALADGYDLLRLAIEKRKNQIEALDWNIVPIDKKDPIAQQISNEVYQFFKRPDQITSFGRWQRALVEDVLVIDAPSIYIRRDLKGDVYSFELIDGATIKRNIDETGRTPLPPLPAYQQILEGMPAVDLTTDELLYFPRNQRTHKVYGYSNVEQIIMTVNLAIRRQMYQLGYYTEGNIPEAFVSCPADWGLEQIVSFQGYWDELFLKNQNLKRKARFVPAGATPTFYKENPLKDQFDEWLARIISYSLDLPPTALVKETNRATAETTQDAGKAEGMASLSKYLKEIMDILIQDYMGYKGIEFRYMEEEAQKPLEQAQINEIYTKNSILTADEIREDLGRDPLTDQQKVILEKAKNSAVNPYMLYGVLTTDEIREVLGRPPLSNQQRIEVEAMRQERANKQQGGSDEAFKNKVQKVVAKKKIRKLPPNQPDLKLHKQTEKMFYEALLKGFAKIKPSFAARISTAYEKRVAEIHKLDTETKQKIVDMILDELDYDGWSVLFDDAAKCLAMIARQSGAQALKQVEVTDKDITKFVDANAVTWAKERAAEMVGKKWDGEKLIENPNPRWAITESTRDYLRGTISSAVEEGWSPQKLAKEITSNEQIWEDRAKMIAQTELNAAHAEGNLIGWKESGVVKGKQSLCLHDENYQGDDPCPGNSDAGVIGIDELFPSGDNGPPFHPNCKCVLLPALDDA